ncbi:CHAT domain-containing tetratricopeptide repeat protein [Roseofilum sp. Guam]|uniref:CHAT domain-containing tetratricopeptide repeat protein n=1 Tax=Roseofilum sp. Guam TaxID=2821502 RepID=UPI001B22D4FB|nr:CHAT domain-containing protein [Roseofilum sp. Guam]MBP0031136.1 CHAT domain-containing protein [Roseofilum sp. Guam]
MKKFVGLKLEGDLTVSGCRVTLEIGREGEPRQIEQVGRLPECPDLYFALQQWKESYDQLGRNSRLEPGKIVYDGSIVDNFERCRDRALELKEQFQIWLRSPSFQDLDRRLREELQRDDEIRFLIRTEIPELQQLPWHLWDLVDRYRRAEVALSQVSFEPCQQTDSSPEQMRVLAILGNSEGIDIERDRHILESLPDAQVTFLVEPQLHQITDHLWSQPWDIIFFAGHSETEGDAGRIYINSQDSILLTELWYGLRQAAQQGLQLVIFNSCDGLGLARDLEDLAIPYTIVMREKVPDRIAQEFLKSFLHAFSHGQSFHLSAREARERLQAWEDQFPCASWLPIIYQHPTAIAPTWPQPQELTPISPPVSAPASNLSRRSKLKTLLLVILGISLGAPTYGMLAPEVSKRVDRQGAFHYDEGRMTQALFFNGVAIAIAPWTPQPYYNRGWVCKQKQELNTICLFWYERAANKGHPDAQAEAAYLNIRLGNLEKAIYRSNQCIERPVYPGIELACWKNRGWARIKQERWIEAKEDLEKAISLSITKKITAPHAACLLAQVWEREGNLEKALDYWHKTKEDLAKDAEDKLRERSEEQDKCLGEAISRLND